MTDGKKPRKPRKRKSDPAIPAIPEASPSIESAAMRAADEAASRATGDASSSEDASTSAATSDELTPEPPSTAKPEETKPAPTSTAKPEEASTATPEGARPAPRSTAKPDEASTAKPEEATPAPTSIAKPDEGKPAPTSTAKPDEATPPSTATTTELAADADAKADAEAEHPRLARRIPRRAQTEDPIVEVPPPDAKLATPDEELVDWNPDEYTGDYSPDFMLAGEAPGVSTPVGAAAAPVLVPAPPILPSPQEAALEAARIVSQMVDIDSESGAVIAAAAAAGAAIEAANAAQKAAAASNAAAAAASAGAAGAEPAARASQSTIRASDVAAAAAATGGSGHDPVTTVRLSRDRILAALANEDAGGTGDVTRDTVARKPEGARARARTEPGLEEGPYEEFDPVAIAAAAISRLRARARTDLAELRVHYHRHDVLVLLLAFVIIVIAGRVHERLVTPMNEPFSERGLTFVRPSRFLRAEPLPPIAPRLVRDPTGAGTPTDPNLYHVELSAIGLPAKLEVLIDKKPTWSNIVTGLDLDRRSRWGELYTLDDSSVRSISGHDWLRTAFRFAHVSEQHDVPRVDHAVEYATIDRDQLYVITMYGTPAALAQVESVVAPTLRVPTRTGLPLVPQVSQRKFPRGVGRAFSSTVMVVVADLVDGRLRARGGGSGVIVGPDGSILTNYHVLHDKDGRLHDTFVIGRFSELNHAPQLSCAGRPNRSKLLRELDLALIKCDMDLDGRTWVPAANSIWPILPEARVADIKMGQRLWILGYPDVGGGGLTISTGEVEGWTGEDGAQGKDFIKTNASISHGNSGGPVIDDQGKLVGIAAAFRTRVTASGGVIETAQIGLVRPLQSASNLLAYAAAGWTPREGYTDVELTPTAIEAAAEGVRIYTTVIDDANEAPVRDATVMVLKAGVNTGSIDMNRLDDQAIAWGKTNALGEVRLKQLVPVPGTYTVMVVAPGYEPLIGENELRLDEKTPTSFDPWGRIGLRSR